MKSMIKTGAALLGIAVLLGAPAVKARAEDKPAAEAAKPADAAKPAAEAPKVVPPETMEFKQTGALKWVTFPHVAHINNVKADLKLDAAADPKPACDVCHGGDKPLFPQKKAEAGMKMADYYAGKQCGACHDGKKMINGKVVFAAKAGCMKCHKTAKTP